MLGGLASYGSDSESDGESNSPPTKTTTLPAPASKPAPKAPDAKSSTGLALPPPKKRRDGPIRITVEAPKFEDEDGDSEERAAKKPRTAPTLGGNTKGAGSSSLFAALPAPKNATPVAPQPTRVLGGGGGPALSFSSVPSTTSQHAASEEKATANGLFLPPSMAKGKAKEALPTVAAAPAVDFFSLGAAPSAAPAVSAAPDASPGSSVTLLSAPDVKDFEPPAPTPYDPYPGYYQLPSGEWKAHDPKVYQKFLRQLTSGVDVQTDNQTKSEAKEFAERSGDNMATFDPTEELRKGQIAERERKKAITATPAGAPAVPRMKVQKATGLARTRHQLSTLLTEAYENREALEEKIAQGKRNRKEAGTKYGF
ncbi:hypothetical protein FRC06_003778 [Ceratobasidium sp. 370]|nr:hypothetical protein FRC06_003778 [Ceratobasidium sp. 370]